MQQWTKGATALIGARARRQWKRRATIALVGLLTLILGIDPTMISPIATSLPSAVAAEVNPGLESRAEHVDQIVAGLDIGSPISAGEVSGGWPAATPTSSLASMPATAPTEDEQIVTLGGTPTAARQTNTASSTGVDLGGMDVTIAPTDGATPEAVKLRVAGDAETRASGIVGVLLDVTDASSGAVPDGEVELTLSYETFAGLGKGDWATRLRLVRIPACDTASPECAPEILPTTNNLDDQTVTAVVPVAESPEPTASVASFQARSAVTVSGSGSIAVMAAASGPAGNWGATKLAPSSTWGTSGGTGAFTWSYPIEVPTVQAGPTPDLSLSYSSAASDGRTPATNNQAGWLGEGFDLSTGYIERSYVPCDQNQAGGNNAGRPSGDLCWGVENATMVFNGGAVELVKDTATGTWKAKNDDGSRIEHIFGGAYNGGEANEYWKVTTPDGIQYTFGRGRRSAADTTDLKSSLLVPVYGNQTGERCYKAPNAGGFASSRCNQVWRWNLEYVVDMSGNSMTYRYERDSNGYVYDYTANTQGAIATYNPGG